VPGDAERILRRQSASQESARFRAERFQKKKDEAARAAVLSPLGPVFTPPTPPEGAVAFSPGRAVSTPLDPPKETPEGAHLAPLPLGAVNGS
jgi:hypothetical protein